METFHPAGEAPVLPHRVQGARPLALPWTWVLGHGDEWCEPSAAILLPLSSCQAAFGSRRCPGVLPSAQAVPGDLTCSPWEQGGAWGRGVRVCWVQAEAGEGILDCHPKWHVESQSHCRIPWQQSLGKNVGEAVVGRLWWAAELISAGCCQGHVTELTQTSSCNALL